MHRDGVEAVVDRDVAGERIIDPLLGFDRQHRAPSGHELGPFDGVDTDIGAAIDRDDAVTMMLAAKHEQVGHQLDLGGIEAGLFQDLEAHAVAAIGVDHAIVETVDDHGPVIG